jgi:hypothetical protein
MLDTIKIRQNKKTLIPMIAFLIIAIIGITYYEFFSGEIEINNITRILHLFVTISLLYTIYIVIKKFLKNEPVLIFSPIEFEINEKGKPVSFLWLEILDWKIIKEEEGNTHYLILETIGEKKKINISWLDKSPSEIEGILMMYKKSK